MDRTLHVLKDGGLFVEMIFNYQTPTSGQAWVTVNAVDDLGGGITTVRPLYTYPITVEHEQLFSIAEIENFDHDFLKQQPEPPAEFKNLIDFAADDLQFTYPAVHYRYLIGTNVSVGVADIYTDFAHNRKELKFTSTRQTNFDTVVSSNSLVCNIDVCNQLCDDKLHVIPASITRLGWNA